MKINVGVFSLIFLVSILSTNFNNNAILPHCSDLTEDPLFENRSSIQSISDYEIRINGNENFTAKALSEGWPGNGSQSNPYLLSGLSITYILRISHVNCYFIVSDSSMNALRFDDVRNGQIIHNDCNEMYLYSSSKNRIINNTIDYLSFHQSFENHIVNNTLSGLIEFDQSTDNTIKGNQFTEKEGGLHFYGHDLDSYMQREVINNSIKGKSILYWKNKVNESISSIDVGRLILVNCSRIKVTNINLTGLFCHFCDHIEIFNIILEDRLYLVYSSSCNISNISGDIDLIHSNNNSVRNNFLEEYSIVSLSTDNSFINNTINWYWTYENYGSYNRHYYYGFPWGWEYLGSAIEVHSSHNNIFVNNTFPGRHYRGAIWLSLSHNNLITRNILPKGGDFKLSSSFNNTLSHNILLDIINDRGKFIFLRNSTKNKIISNNLSSIEFYDSSLNIIKDNLLRSEVVIGGATIESYIQAEVINNSVNGKPLLYCYSKVNETIPVGAGQILLINCSMISISNQVDCGIFIHHSQQLKIHNNFFNSTNSRIFLESSLNCIITNNTINEGEFHGISLSASTNCSISNNSLITRGLIYSYYRYGIILYESSNNNNINNNEIKNFSIGIYLWDDSSNNRIFDNTLSNNAGGITLDGNSNNVVSDNTLNNNGNGIELSGGSNNIIKRNLILESRRYGLDISGSVNNIIFLNSFINSTSYQAVEWGGENYEDNTMDNWFFYNYWSDWTGPDDNHDNIVDVPYIIGIGGYPTGDKPQYSQDSYPLSISPHSQFRVLIPPNLMVPNGREIIKESVSISWYPAYDTFGHPASYTLYFSNDSGNNWIFLTQDLITTEFLWDVSKLPSGSFYMIKVVANFKDGASVSDISDEPFIILNTFTTTSTTTSVAASPFFNFSLVLLVGLILGMSRKLFRRKK